MRTALNWLNNRSICGALLGICCVCTIDTETLKAGGPVTADDQRADLWGWPLIKAWVPYRAQMNRPRYFGGMMAAAIEPTSLEAMSWKEHHAAGSYRNHVPGYVKQYNFPKPWDVLPIDARPRGAANESASTAATTGNVSEENSSQTPEPNSQP
jgi:hypothetical protein